MSAFNLIILICTWRWASGLVFISSTVYKQLCLSQSQIPRYFFFLPVLTSLTSAGLLKIFGCNSTTWWTAVNFNVGLIFSFWSFQPSSRWSLPLPLADIPIFSILPLIFPLSYFMLHLGHLCILRLIWYIQVLFLRWTPPSVVCREW